MSPLKHVKSSLTESITIRDAVQARGSKVDGMWVYADGWSDARIAKETPGLGPHINSSHVAHVRKELFGNIRPRTTPTTDDMNARIAALERRVADLEEAISAPPLSAHRPVIVTRAGD